jgi:hypothetical protein
MFGSRAYRVFWISAFAALIAVGAPLVGKPLSTLPLVDRGRDSSVNSVLNQTLGEPELGPQISEWLAGLPRGRPVLIVAAPEQMSAALTADLISYLAWPRPVVVSCDREESKTLLRNFRERYCAVGLCYLNPPPGLAKGKSFGPALTFIVSEPKPE